jgi:hypothetical protein
MTYAVYSSFELTLCTCRNTIRDIRRNRRGANARSFEYSGLDYRLPFRDDIGARSSPRTTPKCYPLHCNARIRSVDRHGRGRGRCQNNRHPSHCETEGALPYVAVMFAVRRKFVSPRVDVLVQATTSGELPFGLCRQTRTEPLTISLRVVP